MTTDYALLQSRRRFLQRSLCAGFAAMAAMPGLALGTRLALPAYYADPQTTAAFWAKPRTLHLVRPASGDEIETCYWRDDDIDPSGYGAICRVLRDVRADEVTAMDLRLLDLCRGLQGWLELAYGLREPLIIQSGYRSHHTNERTEGAARNSLHLYGKAVDIRVPGLPTDYLGRLLAAWRAGGVGFYLNKQFIHVDVGRVRFWAS